MRKFIPAIVLIVMLCFCFSPAAFAVTYWQIDWEESGALQEKVILNQQEMVNTGADWQTSHAGSEIILSRNVADWKAYNDLTDKLPLQAAVKDLLCCKLITLTALPEASNGILYSNIDPNQNLHLVMNVPGIVLDSVGATKNENEFYWEIKDPMQGFGQDFVFRAIIIDGMGLGISILILGTLTLAIFFIGRMRKVNRLIDETYSLDNIVIEDEDEEETESSLPEDDMKTKE